jgi:hypothetical protein
MSGVRVEMLMLTMNVGVAAGYAVTFVLNLRGAHRFPTEVAIFASILIAVLLTNAAYFWRHRRLRQA